MTTDTPTHPQQQPRTYTYARSCLIYLVFFAVLQATWWFGWLAGYSYGMVHATLQIVPTVEDVAAMQDALTQRLHRELPPEE
jgi:hypothetical protein